MGDYSRGMNFWDVIFPKKCIRCGRWGAYVCERCEVGLWEAEQVCPGCGYESEGGVRHGRCEKLGALDGLIGMWTGEGMAKSVIRRAKDRYYFDGLDELVKRGMEIVKAGQAQEFWEFLKIRPVLVCIPLHSKKLKERGFNQTEIMGRILAKGWQLEVKNWMVRVRNNERQTSKSLEARVKNIDGAFEIKAKVKVDGNVVIVDDVWVTGATLQEGAKVLKQAGAKKVWGLVLAR